MFCKTNVKNFHFMLTQTFIRAVVRKSFLKNHKEMVDGCYMLLKF